MRRWLAALTAIAAGMLMAVAFVQTAPQAKAAPLVQVTNFGNNPSSLQMYIYVPNSVKANPPILLALHQCTGSGPGFYSGTSFASLADQYGFIVIYPSVTRSGSCWDVSSSQALTRNGGSDPVGLMSMITYTEQHYGGNPNAVYVTGASSGAMMTNVMLGDYPDVFKAGAAFMGVPFGCFYTGTVDGWNSACANGQVTNTAQAWGNMVRNADPGYSGPRPRMQLWHGTADTTLNYENLSQEILQWTNVLGVSSTPASTTTPVPGWTETQYDNSSGTPEVEAFSIAGAGHVLPVEGEGMEAAAIGFMGLNTSSSGGGGGGGGSGGGTCHVAYSTTSQWTGGFTASVTITNTGTAAISSWTLKFTFLGDQHITSAWNGTASQSGENVTITNASYNGTIAPGGNTSAGFQGTWTNNDAAPASFTVNGTTCT
jgi:poly(hydroxyalkanoate) depolymerase family esterase